MGNFNLENYIPVNERLALFYKDFPNGRVTTELIEHNLESGFVMFKANAFRDREDAEPSATGHAFEERTQGYVNKTSYIENCETSAVGRALALLGYEISKGIASREEMAKVKRMEQQPANSSAAIIDRLKQDEKKSVPMNDRLIKAQQAIRKLDGRPERRVEGESDADYLARLTDQYKDLKEAKV
jgi:hypothetical protein